MKSRARFGGDRVRPAAPAPATEEQLRGDQCFGPVVDTSLTIFSAPTPVRNLAFASGRLFAAGVIPPSACQAYCLRAVRDDAKSALVLERGRHQVRTDELAGLTGAAVVDTEA